MVYHIIIIILGFFSSIILYRKFPGIIKGENLQSSLKVSVIIPARNEEKTLPLLLDDLQKQTFLIHEIICIDDESIDKTYEIASRFGVEVISVMDKPADWTGKAWACQIGAKSASGDLLLFLDADVRLSATAITNIICAYEQNQCVISVQPYHNTVRFYEQFSFFFNLIQVAGNGTSVGFKAKSMGLCGPLILIDAATYNRIGGHEPVKQSIVDDIALGEKLNQLGICYKVFLGRCDISFRMYSNGFKALCLGWVKNFSTGATKTTKSIMIFMIMWIASLTTTFLLLIGSLSTHSATLILVVEIALYICWVLELFRISKKIGKYKLSTPILFPIYLLFFIVVFCFSIFKKIMHRHVTWKGRRIKLD